MSAVTVNGQPRQVAEGTTVAQLLEQLRIAPQQVVVEVNLQIIKRDQRDAAILQPDDIVESVRFVGGGSWSRLRGPPCPAGLRSGWALAAPLVVPQRGAPALPLSPAARPTLRDACGWHAAITLKPTDILTTVVIHKHPGEWGTLPAARLERAPLDPPLPVGGCPVRGVTPQT